LRTKIPEDSLFFTAAGPLLFGHRGYSSLAPENTLAAFRLLLKHDIPGVELDVQLCASGEAVVIHDETLERTTGHSGRVTELTAAQIRRLDAGSWFSPRFAAEKIPFLDEVFALLGDRVYYDLEMKTRQMKTGALEAAVLERIRAHGLRRNCLISSFNPASIRAVKQMEPAIPTAHIYSRSRKLPVFLRHGEAAFIIPACYIKPNHRLIRPWTLLFFRRLAGCETIAWSVDDPASAARLSALGVRGIVSRDPGSIREALSAAAFS
jgi:glycerophosphoryl diester phosphodiesterase